jgi:hypothetical protein
MNRLRITQTLLSAYRYIFLLDDGYESFLKTLNREKEPPTQAMLNGVQFEGMVNAALDGAEIPPDHEWHDVVMQCADILAGSQQQVTIFREYNVDGVPFLLHGVLDFLRAGQIFDTKFSTTYHRGKYLKSPQTPMYFQLVPEAFRFTYVISDGKYVYTEAYEPDEVEPIDYIIKDFWQFLKRNKLTDIYAEKWKVNN